MDKLQRSARMARILERLQRVDDGTLEVLDRLTAQALVGSPASQERGVSRRQFVGTLAGGALVALTGGLTIWQLSAGHAVVLEDEAAALRQVVDVYGQMEQARLDQQVEQGLAVLGPLLERLRGPAQDLLSSVQAARDALLDFQSRFPSLRLGFQWLQENLAILSQRLLGLENGVNEAIGLSAPLTETMGVFLAELFDRLPAATAQRLRPALERIGEMVTAIPAQVQGLYTRILEPMDGWFSHQATAGLNGWIVNPLLTTVLDPAQALAEGILDLAQAWDDWAGSVQEGLSQRQVLREEVARLCREHGL